MQDLLIGLHLAAQVPAEPVFVKLLMGLDIPETAGIRGNFIGQNNSTIGQLAELQLKIHQLDIQGQQILLQHLVDLEGILRDGVQFFSGSQAQGQDVVIVDQGIS